MPMEMSQASVFFICVLKEKGPFHSVVPFAQTVHSISHPIAVEPFTSIHDSSVELVVMLEKVGLKGALHEL